MKPFINYSFISLLTATLFLLACGENNNDDDDINTHNDAIGDVFVKKQSDSTGSHYALVFYAYAQGVENCRAIAPNGTEYALLPYWRDGSQRYLPKPSDYKSSMPDTGDYSFHFEFDDGLEKKVKDKLYNIEVDAISAATITHGSGYHGTSVSWSTVDSVDEYVLQLRDHDLYHNQALFWQGGFTVLDNGHYFDSTTIAHPGWDYSNYPAYGDSCYILVEAWKNEPGSQNLPQKNRQMLSDKKKGIIW